MTDKLNVTIPNAVVGYNSLHKPDQYSVQSGKPKFNLQFAVPQNIADNLINAGLSPTVGKDGNLKDMSAIGAEGVVFKGDKLAELGPVNIIDESGAAISGLLGYGSTVTIKGTIATYKFAGKEGKKLYLNSIIVNDLVEMPASESLNMATGTVETGKVGGGVI